jgi:hypothetical protein
MLRVLFGHFGEIKAVPLEYQGVYGRCLVFNQKSRECELSWEVNGRAHLKNSIYWVVFPDLGIFYQKCHDAECKLRILRGAQPPLEDIELVCEELSCTVRNAQLDVQCVIALQGRGQVRKIPHQVLFWRLENNLGDRRRFICRSLSENVETAFGVMDLLSWRDGDREDVLLARRWNAEGRLELVPFDGRGTTGVIKCGPDLAMRLCLVGAALFRRVRSSRETGRRVLARVRRHREMEELVIQQGDVVRVGEATILVALATCGESQQLLFTNERGEQVRHDPKEISEILGSTGSQHTQPKTQPM